MDVYEITGFSTGVSEAGVNYLQPKDSFQNIQNGFIYRQVLQSRQGFSLYAPRLADESRVFGIFEYELATGEKELLVADQNFLYKYNTATSVFDQIPFGGSMAAYLGFNIPSKRFYISGASYPTKLNVSRFVFTGEGINLNSNNSAVFFYDGTSVKDFTNLVDNPDYQPFAGGPLNRAIHVVRFGERLNFVVPFINSVVYQQGILYSGIRDSSGNGDKFNVPGSGLIEADTAQNLNDIEILGQTLSLHFDRSNYIIEKTSDVFNPYFIRKVPSVLGTNAKFTAVQWDDSVKSMGKTGVLGTDSRETLRIDNKIPYFTANNINPSTFNLTFGYFDRTNNQFIWSYRDSVTELETQNKILVYNYEESSWSVFDARFSVFGQTDVGINLTWDEIDETKNPAWRRWDSTTDLWDEIGIEESTQKTLAGDDLGFIYQLNTDYDDYFTNITAISQATQAVLTVDPSAFQIGDLVSIQSVEGMTEINNYDPEEETSDITFTPYEIVAATDISITLNVDSSDFDPYTTGGAITKVIEFSAETIPFNPYRSEGRRCYISHVEFLLDTNGGNLKVDVFEDEEESPFKDDTIVFPIFPTTKSRQWVTLVVDNEANFMTFRLKQQSPSVQMRLTSMRIHCQRGGFTSG